MNQLEEGYTEETYMLLVMLRFNRNMIGIYGLAPGPQCKGYMIYSGPHHMRKTSDILSLSDGDSLP